VTRFPLAVAALAAALVAESPRADSLSLHFARALYGNGAEGALRYPEGVACGDGVVVVADTGNDRLLRFPYQNGVVGPASVTKLDALRQPTAVEFGAKGDLFVLDRKARKIGRVAPNGEFKGFLEVKGLPATDSVVPVAFKVTAGDGLVLLDASARRVLVLDAQGVVTRQVPLPKGEFTDLAADPGGILYAVDSTQAVVWALDKGANAFRALTKPLKDVLLFPAFMAATDKGVLLLADQHGHGVVLVGLDGSFMGRQLSQGFGEGALYYPSQLCMTGQGEVLVADRANNRVQVFATQR